MNNMKGEHQKHIEEKYRYIGRYLDKEILKDIITLAALACDILEEIRDDMKLRKDDGR